MTVLEVIQRSTDFLAQKGVDSPRLQAELLLAHVLKLPRMQLYLNFQRVLAPADRDSLRELVKRRGGREPLQHILGSTCFCGLELAVNRHVLIPRPETELLAEQGWVFLNQLPSRQTTGSSLELDSDASEKGRGANPTRLQFGDQPLASEGSKFHDLPGSDVWPPKGGTPNPSAATALDFGTGSGCLAIALATRCPRAQIFAVDVVPEALELAGKNAARHGVIERITFALGNGLSALPREQSFDLIVGNPPYIPSPQLDELQPEVRDYDPRVALDGGVDGLDFYRRLAAEAGAFLRPGGKMMLEFGDGQEERIARLFRSENWIVERIVQDYNQRPRILIARTTL